MAGPLRSFRDAVNLSPCSSVVWQPGHAAVSTPPPLPWRRMPRPGPAPAATATRAPGGARASQTQLRACAAPAGAAATSQTSCSPVLRPRSHAAPSPTLSVALESVNGRGISTTCCLAIPSPRVRAEGPRAQKPAYLSQHPSTSAGSPAGSPTPRELGWVGGHGETEGELGPGGRHREDTCVPVIRTTKGGPSAAWAGDGEEVRLLPSRPSSDGAPKGCSKATFLERPTYRESSAAASTPPGLWAALLFAGRAGRGGGWGRPKPLKADRG